MRAGAGGAPRGRRQGSRRWRGGSARPPPAGAYRDGSGRRRAWRGRLLDDEAPLHHRDALAVLGGKAEIVGDEDHRHAAPRGDLGEQVHDRLLRRHVEAGGRLVGDEQGGLAGDRHGDHDALAHAAGELVRIGVEPRLGIADHHRLEQLQRAGARLLRGERFVGAQHVGDLQPDRADRVQRRPRVLEDHRHGGAAQRLQHPPRGVGDVLPAEGDAPAGDLSRAVEELHHREGGDRLAGAALADDAQRLAGGERQRHALDGVHRAVAGGEGDLEVLDGEERAGHVRILGSRMSRNPSPSRLKQSTAVISAAPGKTTSHHLPVVMKRAPSATMMPHSGVGAWTPSRGRRGPRH